MRLLVSTALFITGLFALILGGLRLQAQTDTVKAAFGDCTLPCWQGVKPGVTSMRNALAFFNATNGFAPIQYSCSSAPGLTCARYIWASPPGTGQMLATEMEIVYGEIGEIDANSPGFTLGEVLLLLNALHVDMDGTYPAFEANHQFYVQIFYADSHLVVDAAVPCAGTYLDLLETPVSDVIIESPGLRLRYPSMTSFTETRARFEQLCAR